MTKISFTAAGDYVAQKKLVADYEGFEDVRDFISQGDVRFFNYESTIPTDASFGNQFHGGTYMRSGEESVTDALSYGFNITSCANNHTLDYSYDGLLNTLSVLEKYNLPSAGVGRNLDEAAAPAYITSKNGRVALISVVSTMVNEAAMAGKQSRRVPGRPGINGLRVKEKLLISKEQMKSIKDIVEQSHVTSREDIMRDEGWLPQLNSNEIEIKKLIFEEYDGDSAIYQRSINEQDLNRVLSAISEAKKASDEVIISVHTHELSGNSKENPADFISEFAHLCIDAGACAIIGHGPHLLRPLEIYKGAPIFYSLGNFFFQEEVTEFAPEDLYESYGLTSDAGMQELYRVRTKDYTRGLLADPRFLESVIPYFEVEDGKTTKLLLYPIELGYGKSRWEVGIPTPAKDDKILHRLAKLSEAFGTKINIKNGVGEVVL